LLLKDIIYHEFPFLHWGDKLEKAVRFFRQSKLELLPVVSDDMRLVGVLTRANFLDALLKRASLDDPVDTHITLKENCMKADMGDIPFEKLRDYIKSASVGTAPFLDSEGNVCGIVTKTKIVLSLLKESDMLNAQLKAVLDAMHNAVVAVSGSKKITLINRSAEKSLWGL